MILSGGGAMSGRVAERRVVRHGVVGRVLCGRGLCGRRRRRGSRASTARSQAAIRALTKDLRWTS